ncbi:sigma-54 interaction domain-containing protein [Vulgatibacter incomptus]|uniref:sigma-54 interaction domain-containing protein n=1 Tax=Vulgatibacter incomptus TaxID=1391653 RepID=UPI001F0A3041|nr:sigma 54-interacting transcriptional regulator [Vulgatibacter incomptus]
MNLARLCKRIAASEATVLITGETGTGKEVFARLVHEHSARVERTLVPVNCAAIPEALLESELFGYVRGAFTGAFQSRKGRIALADGGTLFLDEIGELPLSLQAKLLRVLQERSYEPVGSTEPVPANFRLVAATNRDLTAEVEAGRFRRDLYYRLLVCPLELPALRERRADIAPLFLHFWRRRGESRRIAPEAMVRLCSHDWPGNVRELENLVERLSICAEGEVIEATDLPEEFRRKPMLHPLPDEATDVVEATPIVLDGGASTDDDAVADLSGVANEAAAEISSDAAWAAGLEDQAPARESVPRPDATFQESPEELEAVRLARAGLVEESPSDWEPVLPLDLPALLRAIEDRYIETALRNAEGNKKAAADLLGLQRTTLVEKLRRRNRDAAPPDSTANTP